MKSPRDAFRASRRAWRRYSRARDRGTASPEEIEALSRTYGERHVAWLDVHTSLFAQRQHRACAHAARDADVVTGRCRRCGLDYVTIADELSL